MEPVQQAVAVAQRVGQVLLATADERGMPHVSVGTCTTASGHELTITEWFCPGTMRNLEQNRRVAVVAWDPVSDTGYQMLGHVEAVHDVRTLGCVDPANPDEPPATERALLVAVEQVLGFSRAPHSDRQLPAAARPPAPARQHSGPRAVRAAVDRAVCIGAASCVGIAPQVYFVLDPDGLAHAVGDDVPPEDEDLLRQAALSCPVQAISLYDVNGAPIVLEEDSST